MRVHRYSCRRLGHGPVLQWPSPDGDEMQPRLQPWLLTLVAHDDRSRKTCAIIFEGLPETTSRAYFEELMMEPADPLMILIHHMYLVLSRGKY